MKLEQQGFQGCCCIYNHVLTDNVHILLLLIVNYAERTLIITTLDYSHMKDIRSYY